MKDEIQRALRNLPSVDETVRDLSQRWEEQYPRWALVRAVQQEIARIRALILKGEATALQVDPALLEDRIQRLLTPSLRPVFNATGVVVHTNLGRAPLGQAALDRVVQVASGYSTLEYSLEQRERGSRHVHVASLLQEITGAEDAVVVNNNAAAVLLCLTALARGQEVVVSRGELVEIGGSFRIPDVMAASGALLREVGTTNRTHPQDYVAAINEDTALLFKAHRSNFALVGFTAEVGSEELAAIGRERGVLTVYDLGSGTLLDLSQFGLPRETSVQQALEHGIDLVCFSGDKLLGGPQAGIIVGRGECVERLRSHPLMRPLRPDKMTLASLAATLECYRDGDALERVPVTVMLSTPPEVLKQRAQRLCAALGRGVSGSWTFALQEVSSRVGGGALPLASPRSWAVAVEHPDLSADRVEALLRSADPPVVARIEQDRLLLDVRTITDGQVRALAGTMAAVLKD